MIYKVLIVEDDKMIQAINKQYINKISDYKVTGIANNFDEAIKLLTTHTFDLVLIDENLGSNEKSGVDLLQSLREMNLNTEVIMLTAQNQQHIIRLCLDLGVYDYLLKPFKFERLKDSLEGLTTKLKILNNAQDLTQEEVDQLYGFQSEQETPNIKQELLSDNHIVEKGISQPTLKMLIQTIEQLPTYFTINEVTQSINLSHVTIRKYIHYLEKKGFLSTNQHYQSTGRPITYYKIND